MKFHVVRGEILGYPVYLNPVQTDLTFERAAWEGSDSSALGKALAHFSLGHEKDFGIYMVDSSRINVAGITEENVGYLAESIAAVVSS